MSVQTAMIVQVARENMKNVFREVFTDLTPQAREKVACSIEYLVMAILAQYDAEKRSEE